MDYFLVFFVRVSCISMQFAAKSSMPMSQSSGTRFSPRISGRCFSHPFPFKPTGKGEPQQEPARFQERVMIKILLRTQHQGRLQIGVVFASFNNHTVDERNAFRAMK